MPGMMYNIPISGVASPAAIFDAFELTAPADAVLVIHRCDVGQSSDYGDAQAEGLSASFITGYTVSGSGGSAATPVPLQLGFAASGSAAETMNTTVANTGSPVTKAISAFNAQIGLQYRPTPEERFTVSPSERLVVRISAPADALTISGMLVYEELGG